jgi:hypothetical protein
MSRELARDQQRDFCEPRIFRRASNEDCAESSSLAYNHRVSASIASA